MPVPVLVDEIFCRNLTDSSEPLRAPWSQPNKISRGDWIPRVAEAINSAAFEHHEAVFHYVHLDHAQCRSRLVRHGVHAEIETHRVGNETAHLQIRVSAKRIRRDRIFARYN